MFEAKPKPVYREIYVDGNLRFVTTKTARQISRQWGLRIVKVEPYNKGAERHEKVELQSKPN